MTAVPASAGPPKMSLPLWTRGDLNAFFGLGINMLVNVLVLTGLAAGVVQISGGDVFGVILPALGIELLVGNIFYFYMARKLALKQGRTDVTALPYGPSVPHMFIVTFVVMLPTFIATKDPIAAWTAGLAWAFIIGVIILIGAFVGPTIRKFTPRAALLGTLAGISITFISMRPAAQMWEAAWIALPVLALIVIGFVSGVKLPGNFPMGLAALLVGSAIAWAGGFMETAAVTSAAKDIAVGIPSLNLDLLFDGLGGISPLLATAIPLGIYNFTEAMSNVESAAAAGDDYNLRHVLLADGTGAVVGSALGSPFPPAVYVGHPGWKAAGGGVSYSLATGILIFVLCVFGMFPLLGALLPVPAIVPGPALHRPRHRRAGVPGGAEGPLRRDRAGGGAERRGVGVGAHRQLARGRRHERGEGRHGGARQRRRDLRGPAEARRGGRPRGHAARRDRGLHDRPALRLGRGLQLPRRGPGDASG